MDVRFEEKFVSALSEPISWGESEWVENAFMIITELIEYIHEKSKIWYTVVAQFHYPVCLKTFLKVYHFYLKKSN